MRVKFHLPGLRYNYPLNMTLLSMLKTYPEFFRPGLEIASFFGEFPTSKWNGGRFSNGDQCDAGFIQNVIRSINEQGVPIRYTYTNPLLNRSDLDDPYCNFCMKAADNGMNEVLVVSPVLEEYIRKTYPSYKINSSTCKEIRDIDGLNEELEKDYALVVLDYNLNNQFELLEKIVHKERCEILVNACCVPNCSRRGDHYKQIAKQQNVVLTNRKMPPDKQIPVPGWYCEHGDKNTFYSIQDYCTFVSPDDIWEKYAPMGFENFKIEGRTANIFGLIDKYAHYLMTAERRDEGRLLLTLNLEKSKVITVNRPRKGTWP
ncbi:MAG: hypothetical protein J1F42_06000 [Lachnospiraceae bacterium]|nr:hypothetical protein [Lachnospiraceae bacterium]